MVITGYVTPKAAVTKCILNHIHFCHFKGNAI